MPRDRGIRVICENRKARHDYEILETYEAGIVLTGCEIKSIRNGSVNLRDSFAKVEDGEVWLWNMYIAPWEGIDARRYEPRRKRKLLLHRHEIDRLAGRVAEKGLTLVPLRLYLRDGWAKIELALARGRKKADKRRAIAEREAKRELERTLKRYMGRQG